MAWLLCSANVPSAMLAIQFAATKLMALVRREPIDRDTVLPVELIVRRSAGLPR